MALENLFAIEPTLPNVQTHKMPDNSERWAEALTTYIREQYPDIAKMPVTVEIRKKDEQTGTAIGALHIMSEEAKKEVLVPFVIRKFELSPLDIWMEPKTQEVHALTKDTFKELFFVQSPAEGLDARPTDSTGTYFNDPSLWTTNYPPLQGRYSYASAGFQMLDALSDTFSAVDGEVFKQTLRENPMLVAKFQKHGYAEVIEKLARKVYPNSNDYTAAAMQLIPVAAASVKKEDPDKYSLLSSIEGLFDTMQVQKLDRQDMQKFLSKITGNPQDFLNEVDAEGEKMLVVRKPAPGIFVYDEMAQQPAPEMATDFALYRVKTKTGMQVDGIVIPSVVNFSGGRLPMKLFISRTHSSFQPNIAGIRLVDTDDKDMTKKILQPWDIRVGATGTFIYIDDGKAVATEPVTIKAIEDYCGPLTVVDMKGRTFKVERGFGDFFTKEERESSAPMTAQPKMPGAPKQKRVYLDAHGFLEVRKDIFVIPRKMCWVPMSGFNDVTASPGEWITKEAAAKMELDPLTIHYTGIVYDVSGAGLPKLALSERETKVLLATAGVPLEKIAAILKRAKSPLKAKVHGVDRLEPKASKVSKNAKLIAKISSIVDGLKKNLIKEAADLPEDSDATVDALLSLNFLNPNNLAKFVAYKPVFDKVLDYLAELTLASRLGLKDINEGSTVLAMSKLMEVCDGLHKLQASVKRPSTKTAATVPPTKGKRYLPSKRGKLIAAIGG